jgi:oxygen-independent coproporphyrinogen III oxidase
MEISPELIARYDKPVPRYTSYPTVPAWKSDSLTLTAWKNSVRQAFVQSPDISLYIHLPFCEKLCTYCGCNKKITNNHGVEDPYIHAVLREWSYYLEILGSAPRIREIHLGGGTPTFFSPENLRLLIQSIRSTAQRDVPAEYSVEVHPVVTTEAHLQALAELGFTRLSAGIQDFDPEVQRLINRIQSPEQTAHVIQTARQLGFSAVNVDIIYGLPRQTQESIRMTLSEVLKMRPERIAFYSYAHVPWKSPGQRLYDERDLPVGLEKRQLYELGRTILLEAGYQDIGMDHFALPQDPLLLAAEAGELHRNFMGYTTAPEGLLIGLGASAISDSGTAFFQNEKDIKKYQQITEEGRLPYLVGHLLSHEDTRVRRQIQDLMCQGYSADALIGLDTNRLQGLKQMETEGILTLSETGIQLTETGKPFLRNVCSWIDRYYGTEVNLAVQPVFSKAL